MPVSKILVDVGIPHQETHVQVKSTILIAILLYGNEAFHEVPCLVLLAVVCVLELALHIFYSLYYLSVLIRIT